MQLHPHIKERQAHAGKYQAYGVRHTQPTRQYCDQRGNKQEQAELRKAGCHGKTCQFRCFLRNNRALGKNDNDRF